MAIKHFHKGSAVFKCNVCGRGTRDTGVQSAGNKICPQCFDLAGLENEVSDGYKTLAEAQAEARGLIEQVEEKGGDVSEWRETFRLPKEAK